LDVALVDLLRRLRALMDRGREELGELVEGATMRVTAAVSGAVMQGFERLEKTSEKVMKKLKRLEEIRTLQKSIPVFHL
jgi:hypothetical protein